MQVSKGRIVLAAASLPLAVLISLFALPTWAGEKGDLSGRSAEADVLPADTARRDVRIEPEPAPKRTTSQGPEISQRAYLDMIATLASQAYEGRGPGTAGLVKARDYIVDRFKKAGLRPVFGGDYTQPLPLDLGARLTHPQLTLAGGKAKPEALAHKKDFAVRGFSAAGAFAGKAVFVGYGITLPERAYDSYGKGLAGAVAVAYRFEPMTETGASRWSGGREWSPAASLLNKADWAKARGASALVVVNPPGVEPNDAVPAFQRTGAHRRAGLPVIQMTRRAFAAMLARAGIEDPNAQMTAWRRRADEGAFAPLPLEGTKLSGKVTIKTDVVKVHNVAGLIPGSGKLADQVVLLVAHYDHLGYGGVGSRRRGRAIHPGADDNASGTAAAVLLGERLQAARAAGGEDGDRRAVMVVAFSAEERGLVGSRYFASHLQEAGLKPEQITAVVNLDMIGRPRDGTVMVFATGTSKGWAEVLRPATTDGLTLQPIPAAGASDHLVFVRQHRVPSIHLCTGLHDDYHRPGDTAEKIDPNSVQVANLAGRIVADLATRPEPLTWSPPEARSRTFLGVGLAREAEGEGVGISSVSPGSPAAKAGIRAGDRIVAWQGRNVQDAMTLVSLVRSQKPGEKVAVTVRRAGREETVTVELGRR